MLAFPLFYLLYFAMQRVMVVRNLLAVIPFLAIAAARGAVVIGELLGTKEDTPDIQWRRANWRSAAWTGLLVVALCVNAWWLMASAESIVARHTDRFVREAAEYIREHTNTKFLLSPRVTRDVAMVAPPLENITANPAEADVFVLYAREGMRRWHDWPANRPGLTQACFGPREVNFDIYPNWWGDDHIIAISRHRAEEISLQIAGVSQDEATATAINQPVMQSITSAAQFQQSPCRIRGGCRGQIHEFLSRAQTPNRSQARLSEDRRVEDGNLTARRPPTLLADGLVVSPALISTSAFNLERYDPRSAVVSDVGASRVRCSPRTIG